MVENFKMTRVAKKAKWPERPNLQKVRKSPESNQERIGEKDQKVYNFRKAETGKRANVEKKGKMAKAIKMAKLDKMAKKAKVAKLDKMA